ncbi:MAG: phenylacetic acid degradation bifunctional protein PaaZ, partial [Bacteroidota bacterium]|nr:phenylacetic acid degradation bifunctional protein PaaZ [Bacteroidota bacterium]
MKLKNYAIGSWIEGEGEGQALYDAIDGSLIGMASSDGIDFAGMMQYARKKASPTLRKMTFHERGQMLKSLALYLIEIKSKYYPISFRTGATKIDSLIDIDG